MKLLVTRPIPAEAEARLRAEPGVETTVLEEDAALDRAVLLEAASQADVILALLTERMDAELFDRSPRLRMVANMAVGFDNVDTRAASARGIWVTNTPGVLDGATADLAMALLLATARRLPESERFLRAGRYERWGPMLLCGQEVHGRTLGILGMGRIGEAVARRARLGFGMELLYWDERGRPDLEQELGARRTDLETLLGASDFVSIHLPLTEGTTGLIDAERLARMKPTAVLVNTARGPIVEEAALAAALRSGAIWAAGLDVFEREPEVHPDLLELDNAVLLPHIASASIPTRLAMADLAASNILALHRGEEPPTPVVRGTR
jgi:glyoxylate reductase